MEQITIKGSEQASYHRSFLCVYRGGVEGTPSLGWGLESVRSIVSLFPLLRNHLASPSISVHRILVSLVPSWEPLTWPVYSLPWVEWFVLSPQDMRVTHTSPINNFRMVLKLMWQRGFLSPRVAISFFYFWPHHATCGLLVSWPGIELMSTAVEGEILTTGLQGKSWVANLKPEALRGIIKKEVKKRKWIWERERNKFLMTFFLQLEIVAKILLDISVTGINKFFSFKSIWPRDK